MNSSFETLPNEIFLHEIFPYCALIDLTYAFYTLNQRFTELITIFLRKKIHSVHITDRLSYHHLHFIVDEILPQLEENHRLISFQTKQVEIFGRFILHLSQINTNYLEKLSIDSYIHVSFDSIMQLISVSPQLIQCHLKVLTSFDRSWANGRKWIRWFESLKKLSRDQKLRDLQIFVWVIDEKDIMYFDQPCWNPGGTYTENPSWRVQLQPEKFFYRRPIHRRIQFSRTNDDGLSDCQPS